MSLQFFVSGIGTDVGKTVVSAILSKALKATYWKPVQAGDLDNSDSMKVKNYCSDSVTILSELYRLNTPASPHFSAELDGIQIKKSEFKLPNVSGNLIIEGAGGLMVPINTEGLLYSDIIKTWNLPVILVSKHYLGSINHTLLSLNLLKSLRIDVKLIIYVGEENKSTEKIINTLHPDIPKTRIPFVEKLTNEFIEEQANFLKNFFK